ncbi:protease inhibitor I9 family protein [Micromonospora chokoriensis]
MPSGRHLSGCPLHDPTLEPLATYTGGVPGIAATKPTDGAKLNRTSGSVKAYRDHLRQQRTSVLDRVGVPAERTRVTMETAFNGFAADLTGPQAARLCATRGVRAVYESRKVHAATSHTPDYLGLTGKGGVWKKARGRRAVAGTREGHPGVGRRGGAGVGRGGSRSR